MSIPSPNYNSDWQAIHDYHHEHRVQIEKEISAFHRAGKDDFSMLESLKMEHDFHHKNCIYCLDTLQHRTIADYAEWLFKNFGPAVEKSFYPPFEGFKTMEEVKNAFNYLKNLDSSNIMA